MRAGVERRAGATAMGVGVRDNFWGQGIGSQLLKCML